MTRRRSLSPLGETEMEVLHQVWKIGHATVSEVHQSILEHRKIAYTTILTILNKLARKGYLRCDTSSASYVFSALVKPDDVRHELLSALMDKVFLGSPTALVQTLVRSESLSAQELADIRRTIDDLKADNENHA